VDAACVIEKKTGGNDNDAYFHESWAEKSKGRRKSYLSTYLHYTRIDNLGLPEMMNLRRLLLLLEKKHGINWSQDQDWSRRAGTKKSSAYRSI